MGLLFAAFITLFALDVFGEGYGFWGTIVAFVMHMVPTLLILAVVLLAWRWPWVGGVLFPGLGIYYMIMSRGRMRWTTLLILVGPVMLIGALYWVHWGWQHSKKATR